MGQVKIDEELKSQVRDYLEKQGYVITDGAKLMGKSGIEHTFDMLAQKDDGFTTYNIAICVTAGGDREEEVTAIFSFANKAYDTGIQGRVIIANPELSQEAKQLAQKQRIKVINMGQIESMLELKSPLPSQPTQPSEPLEFENKEQLVESLVNRGYTVEEKAKIRGRSGLEYSFDVLAYTNTDQVSHSLGIDFIDGEEEVSLEEVSVFDTKAYEVGVDEKAIIISLRLSPEAKQFAEHQRIKVFELNHKPAPQAVLTEEKPALPVEEEASLEEKIAPPVQEPAKEEKKEAPATESVRKRLMHGLRPEALQLIPEVMARRYGAIPMVVSGNTLEVAMSDPTDIFALEAFSALSRMRIKPVAATADEVREAIDFNYKGYGEIEKQLSRINVPDEASADRLAFSTNTDAPLAQALNLIIEEAVKARSSDIHIEPEEDRLRIRYRIDGTLQDLMSLPLNVHLALLSRIKILADLNIADRHRAQDGQFSVKAKGREIDIRVATTPTVTGEMAVLRLLDKSVASLGMAELGMLPDSQAKFEAMLKIPYGMILTSGPTGAGKTTTLYAGINSLDSLGRNIITIEDPAEYRFKDINQIQVNPQAGITFASGLRSILRLDPDIIMVGEIRDAETANIAVQAALTGHLMLSSVHASDSSGVVSRLIDLKVEPFLIASAVIGVIGQRMVRRVCRDCGHPIEAPLIEQMAYEKEMGEKRTEFIYGTGCKSCAYTGYTGRVGIFEFLAMSDTIRTMVTSVVNSSEIRAQALKEGMVTMMKDGMRKVKEGITTPSEVLRNAYSGE
ncbi:MAG: type II/IV secretion system protein [Deltaproteobacteria bacterium]|nr:type II/IV secretion system protein [Deltaproteobacteria bacterium]